MDSLSLVNKTLLTDNSHWEGKIDWKLAAPAMGGCINKATEHVSFVDDQWVNNKTGCIEQGEPYGGYHFHRPAYDPVLQAQHFLQIVGGGVNVYADDVESAILSIYKSRHPNVLIDEYGVAATPLRFAAWEKPDTVGVNEIIQQELTTLRQYYHDMGKLSASVIDAISLPVMVEKFLDYVKLVRPGCHAIFYSSPYFWKEHMKYADGTYPNWNGRYDLWEAHYYVEEPMVMPPWVGPPKIHQFTDKLSIPGIPSLTDGDKFYGNPDEASVYFGNGGLPQPPPPPPPLPALFFPTQTIYIRSTPKYLLDGSNIIGQATYNKGWQPTGIAIDELNREWWQVNPKGYCAKWLTR